MEILNSPIFYDIALRAYYRLENANDSGANAYNLTNNGSTPFNAAKFGNGADLGTSNSSKYLSIASDLGINGNHEMSMGGWVKMKTEISSGVYTLFVHESTNGATSYLQIRYDYNGGTRRIQLISSGNAASYNITLGTTDTHHIYATRDITNGICTLYFDGLPVATTTPTTGGLDSTNRFEIGSSHAAGGDYASSIIDDSPILNRVLSPTEVYQIVNGFAPLGGIM